MPCDSVQISRVNLEAAKVETLKAAGFADILDHWGEIKLEGRSYSCKLEGGQLTVYGASQEVAQQVAAHIKRQYQLTHVKAQAQRYGWQVKQVADNRLQLIRR